MPTSFALFLLLISLPAWTQSNSDRLSHLTNLTRIAFGSCNNQNDSQPLWKDVMNQRPVLWMWHGDAIYADWERGGINIPLSYEKQNKNPDYAAMKTFTPIIGTWDDHDYSSDNANGTFTNKKESQKYFLDFIEEPENSPRRIQEGVYTSYSFPSSSHVVKMILLDNRYFKGLDPEYALLGKAQWDWLETEFKESKADLHIIVAGLSIFSPLMPYSEEWREHPKEVNRMLELLKKYNVKAPVFITGDKHFSTIFQYSGQLEFLSSGMTHVAPRDTWWYLGRKYPATYFGIAYGLMDIAWEDSTPQLTLAIRNGQRSIHTTKTVWKENKWVILSQD